MITGLERISRPGRRRYVDPRGDPARAWAAWARRSSQHLVRRDDRPRGEAEGRRRRGRRLRLVIGAMSRIGRKPIDGPRGRRPSTSRPAPCSVKGPEGRAEPGRQPRHEGRRRSDGVADRRRARPIAASTARSTASPAAWSRTWSRGHRRLREAARDPGRRLPRAPPGQGARAQRRLLAPGLDARARRNRVRGPAAHPGHRPRHRQAARRRDRRAHPPRPAAGALQGQGHPLRGRAGSPQGRQAR